MTEKKIDEEYVTILARLSFVQGVLKSTLPRTSGLKIAEEHIADIYEEVAREAKQ